MEKIFRLKEHGTTVKTEVVAGITTFMTMAYIVALNPNILTGFGAEGQNLWNAVFMATCLSSALACAVMGFLANKPFALAPGMGLNSFFAVVVANLTVITGMSYIDSFNAGMILFLVEGLVFIVLTFMNIRQKIVEAIPKGIRMAIGPSIGLMIINIGLGSNAGVYDSNGNAWYVMRDFFGGLTADYNRERMGDAYPMMVLTVITMFIGVFAIVFLDHKGFKAAVFFGIIISSAVFWAGEALFLGINPFESLHGASFAPPFKDLAETTLFKYNWQGFFDIGWFTAVTLIVSFCMIDMFDTIGTFVGTAAKAGMLDENGNMPQMKEAMLADAVGTIAGSATGTSTVTTFVESAAGVAAGGRTGLTAITSGAMFLACIFIAPLIAVIPAAATSSALIYVGIMMLSGIRDIDLSGLEEFAPVSLMLIAMPISGSIGHGIGIGLIADTVIRLTLGKGKDVSILTYIISAIFLVKFFLAL